jgi:D-3-phosphoglycerate dehydrogenase
MISRRHFAAMKKTAVLVNCARGGIVNEADLKEALENGVIAAAGIDVFATEPPDAANPLFGTKNLVYSPHSAAQTREAVVAMHRMCVDGCLAVLRGEKWPHVADSNVYRHPRWKGK